MLSFNKSQLYAPNKRKFWLMSLFNLFERKLGNGNAWIATIPTHPIIISFEQIIQIQENHWVILNLDSKLRWDWFWTSAFLTSYVSEYLVWEGKPPRKEKKSMLCHWSKGHFIFLHMGFLKLFPFFFTTYNQMQYICARNSFTQIKG